MRQQRDEPFYSGIWNTLIFLTLTTAEMLSLAPNVPSGATVLPGPGHFLNPPYRPATGALVPPTLLPQPQGQQSAAGDLML